MKMCTTHWAELRKAIEDRGLWPLVSPTGDELHQRVMDRMSGDRSASSYCPLMDANMQIMNHAVEQGGLYLLGNNPQGQEYCPLCEVDARTVGDDTQSAAIWIAGCTDAIEGYCLKEGYLKPVN